MPHCPCFSPPVANKKNPKERSKAGKGKAGKGKDKDKDCVIM
jgi:hypothetical protein